MFGASLDSRNDLQQNMGLAMNAQARESLRLLGMAKADLRRELLAEMQTNPVLEEDAPPREESLDALVDGALVPQDWDPPDMDSYGGYAEEAAERREYFFDSQTSRESLVEHLLKQIPLAGFNARDARLAEELISHIDDDGYFRDSFADVVMVTGASEAELRAILAKVRTFDPEGCGATNLKECYLAQLDKLKGSHLEEETRIVIEHIEALAAGEKAQVCAAAGIALEDLPDVLNLLKTLDPAPGRGFETRPVAEKISPDVKIYRKRNGEWDARVLKGSIPEVRVQSRYEKMLSGQSLPEATKAYLAEKILRAHQLQDAIKKRYATLEKLAVILANEQSDWFLKNTDTLKPLTIRSIAPQLGLHEATVSRAVAEKWMLTPRGVVKMRDLFASGLVSAAGEAVSQKTVEKRLKELIASENPSSPYSDQRLAELMVAEGYPLARRTVAKYRDKMSIPPASARRR